MIHVTTVNALRAELSRARASKRTIGFVPTMGALHDGHSELARASKRLNHFTVASIFVNTLQFNKQDDLTAYPRTLSTDIAICDDLGIDVVFSPSHEEIYPTLFDTFVEPGTIADILEGASRPGHFRGMATVVLKLLLMCQPDEAFFGKKDYQQLAIVRRMVIDLNVPVVISGIATVRDSDGLALSSRNAQLTTDERKTAPEIFQVLKRIKQQLTLEGNNPKRIIDEARVALSHLTHFTLEYLELVNQETFQPPSAKGENLVALCALQASIVRLIDNIEISQQ